MAKSRQKRKCEEKILFCICHFFDLLYRKLSMGNQLSTDLEEHTIQSNSTYRQHPVPDAQFMESKTDVEEDGNQFQQGHPLKQFLEKTNLKTEFKVCIKPKEDRKSTEIYTRHYSIKQWESLQPQKIEIERKEQSIALQKTESLYKSAVYTQAPFSLDSETFRPIKINIQKFVKMRKQQISHYYEFLQKIGEGAFGSVYRARCKKSNQFRAIKVLKNIFLPEQQKKHLLAEIQMLKKLDHPHIIKLYDLFFHNNFYYVVMEYCEGGPVASISRNGSVSQKVILKIMKQLLSAVSYLHDRQIVHRDIKLENMVLLRNFLEYDDLNIKLIDFGLSVACPKHKSKKTGLVGTVEYMAPEILRNSYCSKSDIWSCGVAFYVMLIGDMPFPGKDIDSIMQRILENKPDFDNKSWEKIGPEYKDLINRMMDSDYLKRINAGKAMKHQCFKMLSSENPKMSLNTLQNLSKYYRSNNFVSVIEAFLSYRKIDDKQRRQILQVFNELDGDGNGTIDVLQLINIYKKETGIDNQQQIEKIIDQIDHNKSGKIDFNQFLVAMYSRKRLFDENSLMEAFEYFDTDGTGYLDKSEVKEVLKGCMKEEIRKLFKQLDQDGDQKITKEEFLAYFLKK